MYILLKPHTIFHRVFTDILVEIETEFDIIDLKWFTLTKEQVEQLYSHHAKKPYFDRIVKAMTKGPCIVVVLKNDSQAEVRALAKRIREDYPKCPNKADNYVHCPEIGEAFKELKILGVVD